MSNPMTQAPDTGRPFTLVSFLQIFWTTHIKGTSSHLVHLVSFPDTLQNAHANLISDVALPFWRTT